MTKLDKLITTISHAAFIKLDNTMYRVDGYIDEEEECELYLLHEASGDEITYDLMDEKAVNELSKCAFFELTEIK